MTKRLTLIRHGRTGYSGKYIGSWDVPLSSAGCRQIKELSNIIAGSSTEKILASPMFRCRQSCELLFPGEPVSYEKDLREINFGRWEGLSFQEIVAIDPDAVDAWASGSSTFCFPGGECLGAFIKRVEEAGKRIASLPEKDITVIAHGGVIRMLLCYFLKLDSSKYLLFKIQKGKFTTLELFSEGAVLTGLNHGANKG